MEPDQQIGLITACEEAQRKAVAAPTADRALAITQWGDAIIMGGNLCTNDFHDALVMKDDTHHQVALQVLARVNSRELRVSFLSDLGSARVTDEQRARVYASLKVISGQDHGTDRAAWEAWLRGQT